MENSDIATESSAENPNGIPKNAGDLHQKEELLRNSHTEATDEGKVKSAPHKNRSKAARTENRKEGNGESNENQRSPEDLLQIIRELDSLHCIVQDDKIKEPNEGSESPFYCELCELKLTDLKRCQEHVRTKGHKRAKKTKGEFLLLTRINPPSKHQTLALSKLLDSVFLHHGLSSEKDLPLRGKAAKDVHKDVCTEFPECAVLLYGSSFTGFGLKDSDVNLDLVIPDELNVPHVLLSILELIKKDDKYCDVKSEFDAKVPRILFKHLSSGLICELSPGNVSASKTSRLLKKYFDADSRVHKLVLGLRYWARICSIDCQSEGGLPGYSLALMVIQFLQLTKPPVLPTWVPQEAIDEDNQNTAENFVSENQEEIGTLWYQLFRFYCVDFDLPNLVITIKDPRPVKREDKKWGHRRIAMEDPFSTKRNVASSLSSDRAYDYLFTCWKNSFRYFTSSPQNGSITEIQNTSSKPPHEKNDNKSVKSKKQESKAVAVDEGIFQMDDLDPLTKQMRSMDVTSNDCEDGSFSRRQTKKKGSSLKSKAQDDAEIEVEISLSGSKEEDNRNSKTDSEKQACGVVDKSKDIVYRFDARVFQGDSKPVKTCCFCKEDGHVKDRCPDLQKPPLRLLPQMTTMFAKVLDFVCQTCRADFEFEKSEVSYRENVLKNLESYINGLYPEARLFLFGSSKNGFGFRNSDIDICMTLEGRVKKEVDCVGVITNLAKLLKNHRDCSNVLAITTAKVPIVKFFLRSCKREADISLYNTLALENTKMLATYAKLDDRVATLGYTVKVFAKVCDIGDASKGSLSSYAYILMLLHYLQQCNPPVIPVLQALHKEDKPPEKIIEGWNCWFLSDEKKIRSAWNQKERNSRSVGLLWYGFLRYYTEEFDFEHDVVCCRRTKKLTKFEKMWTKHVFAIEDPFNQDHNLGAGVTKKMANYILTTFIRGRERFGIPQYDIPRELLQRYFFDVYYLTDGFEAPSDRNCRVCGKIGHIARDCPLSKANQRAEQRKGEKERRLGKEAGEKMTVKQKPFSVGSARPRPTSAPSKQGQNKNDDDSMYLPMTPSRQGANASDVTPLSKSQPDSQDLSPPPKESRSIQSSEVAEKLSEIPNIKASEETPLQSSPNAHSATQETLVESKEGISQPIQTSHISNVKNEQGDEDVNVDDSVGMIPPAVLSGSREENVSNAAAPSSVHTCSPVQSSHSGEMEPPPGFHSPGRMSQVSGEVSPQLSPDGLLQSPSVNVPSPIILQGQTVMGTPPRHPGGMFHPHIAPYLVSPGQLDMWLRQQGGITQFPHAAPVRPLVPYPLSPEVQRVQQPKQQWSGPVENFPGDHQRFPIRGFQRLFEHNLRMFPQSPPNISRTAWPLGTNSPPPNATSHEDPAKVGRQQFASHPVGHPPFPEGISPPVTPHQTQFPPGTPPQHTQFLPGTSPQQTHLPPSQKTQFFPDTPPQRTHLPTDSSPQQTQFVPGTPPQRTHLPVGFPLHQAQFLPGSPPQPTPFRVSSPPQQTQVHHGVSPQSPIGPAQSTPQLQGNSLQHTIGTHMTGEQFISLFRAAEEEVKKEGVPSANPPANDEFESKDLHITPKNLKAAKTPEEHQLLSKLSKVKSLWEGNATAQLQSSCSAPGTEKELNPSGHTKVQESGDVIAFPQDTAVIVEEETCTTVTEKVITKKNERMTVDKVDSTQSVSEKPNGTAPLTQGHDEVASRRVSTEEQHSSTREVTLKGKSEENATTVDKVERKRVEEQEEPTVASATQADAPRKKNVRRGGHGRKAKTQRQNEAVESPRNKQEKTVDDGTKETKDNQVQNQRQKNRVDFKADVSKAPPSSSPKRPGSERPEEKPSVSFREGPRPGADSSKNSTPKKLENERSKVKSTDSSRDPCGRGADSNQISTPKRPRSERPEEKPSKSCRDLPRRDAESNKQKKAVDDATKETINTQVQNQRQKNRVNFKVDASKAPPSSSPRRPGSERSEAKPNESSKDVSRRSLEQNQMSTPEKRRSERSEERPSQSPRDDPRRGAESTPSSNKHKESSTSKKEPGKRAAQETKKNLEKRAPQETKKEPGKGAPQETKKDPGKGAPQEAKKEPGKGAPQETKKDPGKGAAQEAKKDPGKGAPQEAKKDSEKRAPQETNQDRAKSARAEKPNSTDDSNKAKRRRRRSHSKSSGQNEGKKEEHTRHRQSPKS